MQVAALRRRHPIDKTAGNFTVDSLATVGDANNPALHRRREPISINIW
jgi:hypothetical protein